MLVVDRVVSPRDLQQAFKVGSQDDVKGQNE